MSETVLQVKVSRDGKEIGTYPVAEAIRLLVYGTLKETDFYWHEGMTDWAPLGKLQASETCRQLTEKALKDKQKQDEAYKLLTLERAKAKEAKEAEDLAVAEAVRLRIEKEKANYFTCNCCKDTFDKPVDPRSQFFWNGVIFIFAGFILAGVGYALVVGGREATPIAILGLIILFLSLCLSIWGCILIMSSGLRSPFCPGCHSTNYSRPNRGKRKVFD